MVKVRWDNCGREELSWEREQTMLDEYPELFRSCTNFGFVHIFPLCNFVGEILIRGGEL
ncbi:hypothetical protein KSP40_PGU000857 [Platanthera guangdongensis]|uniref:Chromo domain-containing protein n=1 Tax=Platanthera guangdongensis TaxID=2320717 RepID=A0ABR2LIQ5_9ASPA